MGSPQKLEGVLCSFYVVLSLSQCVGPCHSVVNFCIETLRIFISCSVSIALSYIAYSIIHIFVFVFTLVSK